MKLTCPKCETEIPSANINVAEGICACPRCNEVFKIASFLKDDLVATRTPKPVGSKVELLVEKDSLGLILPAGGAKTGSWFLVLFAVLWNGITWSVFGAGLLGLSKGRDTDPFLLLFMLPFLTVGIVVAITALYMFRGEFTLLLDRNECRAEWRLFKWSRTKRMLTSDIVGVSEDVVYTQNHQPVYGITLRGKKPVKFGSSLETEERRWLLGELRHFLKVEA